LHHESWQGQKAEVIIERDLLSEFLHIQGKYDKFRDYRRVLDTCLKHIEEHTDMRLSYSGIREGRKITKLQFHVWYEKNSQNTIFSDSKEKNMEVLFVMNELSSAGFTQDPQKTIETYGIEKVKQAIRQARSAERKSVTSKNPIYSKNHLK
jgi:plasmid replication initiation protein